MNTKIREEAKKAGVFMWQIAKELGVSEMTLVRRLREDLTLEQEQKYLAAIQKLSKGG